MTCPDCDGAKTVTGLAKWRAGRPCSVVTLQCFRCKATGIISDEQARWIEQGERLRGIRMTYRRREPSGIGEDTGYSLREFAWEVLRVPVTELNDAERGNRDPGPLLDRFFSRGSEPA